MVQYLRESMDLSSSGKSKEDISKWIAFYGVTIIDKLSPEGQTYQVVEGEYSKVIGFLSEVFDMSVMEVICNVGDDVWWCKQ